LDDWDWDGPEDVRDDFERVDGRLESGHDWSNEIRVLDEKRWGTMSNERGTRRGSADVVHASQAGALLRGVERFSLVDVMTRSLEISMQ
jgi:hypothetical protein